MYKKASVILVLFTACSLFQQEEQSVVSVADTDKGKEAIALGVELTNEQPSGGSLQDHNLAPAA